MKPSRMIVRAVAVLCACSAFAASAIAQQAASAPGQGQGQSLPDYTDADARAVLKARIAALKAVIELTPEQDKLWPPLEAAMLDIARSAAERRKQRQAAKPASFLDVLAMVAAGEEARARDIRRFIAAAKPLADALNAEQKRRMPAFLGMTDYGNQSSSGLWLFHDEEG
jgi:LTXXQ motif family protein